VKLKLYRIESHDDKDGDGIPLCWSNRRGWVPRDTDETFYTAGEITHSSVPFSGHWRPVGIVGLWRRFLSVVGLR